MAVFVPWQLPIGHPSSLAYLEGMCDLSYLPLLRGVALNPRRFDRPLLQPIFASPCERVFHPCRRKRQESAEGFEGEPAERRGSDGREGGDGIAIDQIRRESASGSISGSTAGFVNDSAANEERA